MFGFVDFAAGLILLVLQISPLSASQLTIGFVSPLQLPNITLPINHVPSLTTRQLARANTLSNALLLILLPSIDTRIPHTGLSLTQAGDTQDTGNHHDQSDIQDPHATLLVLFLRGTTRIGVRG